MLVASKLIPAGAGLAPVLVRRAASIDLDWDTRQKSRFDAVDSQGRSVGVFLARGQVVRGGDVLVAEDGSLITVKAKVQPVLVVTPCTHGSPLDLLRAAYHLGNRHVPLEVGTTRLQLEPDHVLAEMLERMGLHVDAAEAPFEPESGAYDAARAVHAHGPGHDHEHRHDPSYGHDHTDGRGHDHGKAHDREGHDPRHGHDGHSHS